LDRIDVDLRAAMVAQALSTAGGGTNLSCDREAEGDPEAPYPARAGDDGDRLLRLTISAQLKRAGKEMKFIIDGADQGSTPDASLVRLLIRAHSLARRLVASPASNLEDAGAQEGMGAPYAARLIRLNFLAPDIVVAILNGRQPVNLTARKLMTDTRLLRMARATRGIGIRLKRPTRNRRSPNVFLCETAPTLGTQGPRSRRAAQ
jgi:hypothetical protein